MPARKASGQQARSHEKKKRDQSTRTEAPFTTGLAAPGTTSGAAGESDSTPYAVMDPGEAATSTVAVTAAAATGCAKAGTTRDP